MRVVFGCVLVLVACGGRSELGEPAVLGGDADAAVGDVVAARPDAMRPVLVDGVLVRTCGAADAPGAAIVLDPTTDPGGACLDNTPPVAGGTYIDLYVAPATPGTVQASGGQSCLQGTCKLVGSGTVTVTASTATTLTGSYALVMRDGTGWNGTFLVARCMNTVMCG